MRIIEDTPERMVLRDRTLWTSFLCVPVGLALAVFTPVQPLAVSYFGALVALLMAVAMFSSTDLVLDRVGRTCDLRLLTLRGVKRRVMAFDDIQDVRVECSQGRSGPNYRLWFVTGDGEVRLTAGLEGAKRGRYDAMRTKLLEALREPASRSHERSDPLTQSLDLAQPT